MSVIAEVACSLEKNLNLTDLASAPLASPSMCNSFSFYNSIAMFLNLFLSCVLYLFLTLFLLFCFCVGSADASREEEAVNTINDVLSDLGGADNTGEAEQGAPSVEDCDPIPEPLCSL